MVVVFNHCLQRDREAGIISGVGFGLAATVLALVSYLGLSSLRNVVPNLDALMFAISGSILIWFGCKISVRVTTDLNSAQPASQKSSLMAAFFAAFMLNISNPKALALLTGIYGGPLAQITATEAGFFIFFCMVFEFVWYYVLVTLFFNFNLTSLSPTFTYRLSILTKILLCGVGIYLLVQAMIGFVR